MEINILDSYEEISRKAASIITRQLEKNGDMLFCAATGNSPTGTYELLAGEYTTRPELFTRMRVLKLDEWGGIPINDPGSCDSYLQTHLLSPLHIDPQRYLSFQSDPSDPELECRRMQDQLKAAGPIDLCLLGLGTNGHIGLNEPASSLQPGCHIARLSASTLQHSMVARMARPPSYGLTIGMADILQARTVLILVSGPSKKSITRDFLSGKLTTSLPGSFLWLHDNAICLLDKESV